MQPHGHHEREVIESKSIFEGSIFQVLVDKVRLPDGSETTREVVRHPGAVGVVAYGPDGEILLVRQHRHAVEDDLLEIPAGKLNPGEDPWACAKRELEEETGFRCTSMELLVRYYTTPGFSDEQMYLFVTHDLEKIAEAPGHDGDEPLSLEWLSPDEAVNAILDGRIVDAKTIVGLALVKLRAHPEELGPVT